MKYSLLPNHFSQAKYVRVSTYLAVQIRRTTSVAGGLGWAAIAGCGTASRLEYLLASLVFGLGAPLVAVVRTCMDAVRHKRTLRATWTGTAMAFTLTEAIGVAAAFFPHAWLALFGTDPAMPDSTGLTGGLRV